MSEYQWKTIISTHRRRNNNWSNQIQFGNQFNHKNFLKERHKTMIIDTVTLRSGSPSLLFTGDNPKPGKSYRIVFLKNKKIRKHTTAIARIPFLAKISIVFSFFQVSAKKKEEIKNVVF